MEKPDTIPPDWWNGFWRMNKDVLGMPEYAFVRLCRKEIGRSYPESEMQAVAIMLKGKKEDDTAGAQERTKKKESSSKEKNFPAQLQAGQEVQVNAATTGDKIIDIHENLELDKFKLQNKALQRAVARKRVNSVLRLVNKENAEQIVETVVEELLDDKAGK